VRICEYCGKEHHCSYGTGRFCNSKCMHGFSTRDDNYKELKKLKCIKCGCDILINKRASHKCKCDDCRGFYIRNNKRIVKHKKICEFCKQEFLPKDVRVKHCSRRCAGKNVSGKTRKKLSVLAKKDVKILMKD